MITKNEIKFVKSLQIKKNRTENSLFFVEGAKSIEEIFNSGLEIEKIYTTDLFSSKIPNKLKPKSILCKENDLLSMGTFESNNAAIALLKIPSPKPIDLSKLTLVLDDVSDPGNLGTIVRTADWFGITDIVCSPQTTDFYSPKVINATMGSFSRVNVTYEDLAVFFKNNSRPVYGAFLDGKILGTAQLTKNSVLVIGNEAKGINKSTEEFVNEKIKIDGAGNTESLNASVATAILLHEFFRLS